MTKLDWEKTKAETNIQKSKVSSKLNLQQEILHTQLSRSQVLAEKGWQVCPQCKGGRHPSFPICRNCSRTNFSNINSKKQSFYFCKKCKRSTPKQYPLCFICSKQNQYILGQVT